MAELMAEIQQMRGTINTLRARINEQPATNTQTTNRERDLGEALKPPKPEPFTGKAADVVPFITRMKAHFRLFPNRLDTATKKVLYTSPLIQGDAKEWWEPIMRDFLENEENLQEQDTQNIFTNWDNFEQALKDNFGVVNEERQAAAELLALKQHKSCAAYSAKFRQLASKTEWDDEALMEIYYRGLKEEVKDELYLADRPEGGLTEYITMAIKIDERQYERRREKANHKRGNDFNPYYPNQRRNDNHQGNSRNKGQRRGYHRNDTSYGTQSGPMALGAIQPGNNNRQRDIGYETHTTATTNEWKPHAESSIKEPRDPFPTQEEAEARALSKAMTREERNQKAREKYAANLDNPEYQEMLQKHRQTQREKERNDPVYREHLNKLQRARRQKKELGQPETLGMTRSGYEVVPHHEIEFVEPELEPEKKAGRKGCPKEDPEEEEKRLRRNKSNKEYYERCMEDPEKRELYRKRQQQQRRKKQLQEPQTLGVIREGKTIIPKTDEQASMSRTIDDIPMKTTTQRDGSTVTTNTEKGYITKYEAPRFAMTTLQKKEEAVKQEREAETRTRTYHQRHSRSMGHRGGAARLTARYLRKEDERLENKWKQPYEPLCDEAGKRMYLSPEDRYMQGAKEHGNTEKVEEIYVRAYHQHDAMNPLHREQQFNKNDDVRTLPTNPNHKDISWVSCKYHWCEHHRQSKEDNDCFPVTIPGTPNDSPYHEWETHGYSVYHWHENLGVATLRFNLAHYRQIHKTKELLEGIKHSQQLIEEAEKEFEEATQGKFTQKKTEFEKQRQEWEKEYQEKITNGNRRHKLGYH
ncbi:hypothetical protein RAB80_010205 [Fusarium oxysporum f. sp. vasinfectum]|nr:hypothetical protein RAB80_010205 [Fusarium oxysporum f. sp. vasinfectum]